MTRINSLKVPTMPGGFVVDEMLAPPSQVPLAVPLELHFSNHWRKSQLIRAVKDPNVKT